MKNLLKPIAFSVAVLGSTGLVSTATYAQMPGELSASAGVASMYLFRGIDLGDGSAAVFGDLVYSIGGAYVGVWGSSGDSALGNEYDLIAGYNGEAAGFSYGLGVINYNYSDAGLRDGVLDEDDDTTGELTEVVATLGYGPVTAAYYDNVAGLAGFEYYTLAATMGQFTLLAGMHDFEEDDADMTHVDLSYAYNDRLAFTLSKVVEDDAEDKRAGLDGYDDDLKVVVSYSLPIDL